MPQDADAKLRRALERRFADPPGSAPPAQGAETLAGMAARGAQRVFTTQPLDEGLLRLLCAVALSSGLVSCRWLVTHPISGSAK